MIESYQVGEPDADNVRRPLVEPVDAEEGDLAEDGPLEESAEDPRAVHPSLHLDLPRLDDEHLHGKTQFRSQVRKVSDSKAKLSTKPLLNSLAICVL